MDLLIPVLKVAMTVAVPLTIEKICRCAGLDSLSTLCVTITSLGVCLKKLIIGI